MYTHKFFGIMYYVLCIRYYVLGIGICVCIYVILWHEYSHPKRLKHRTAWCIPGWPAWPSFGGTWSGTIQLWSAEVKSQGCQRRRNAVIRSLFLSRSDLRWLKMVEDGLGSLRHMSWQTWQILDLSSGSEWLTWSMDPLIRQGTRLQSHCHRGTTTLSWFTHVLSLFAPLEQDIFGARGNIATTCGAQNLFPATSLCWTLLMFLKVDRVRSLLANPRRRCRLFLTQQLL